MLDNKSKDRKKLELRTREILKELITTGELRLLSHNDMACLNFCITEKYIDGVHVSRAANGRMLTNITKPKVTPKGLAYLYPKKDLRFISLLLIAAGSVILNIILLILLYIN